MSQFASNHRPYPKIKLAPAGAAIIIVFFGLMAHSSQSSVMHNDSGYLARKFKFDIIRLTPENTSFSKKVREVHPSLQRLSSWISATGAAVALGDLDGDGLENDLCLIDTRTGQPSVQCVPHTGARYSEFNLCTAGLPTDESTIPAGCLIADLNEDGLSDILVYYWGRSPILHLQRAPSLQASDSSCVFVNRLGRDSFKPVDMVAPYQRWYTGSATCADLDGDGHLDVFAGNYFADGADIFNSKGTGVQSLHNSNSRAFNGGLKHFLLSNGHRLERQINLKIPVFGDHASVLPGDLNSGWTLAAGAMDLDGDQLPELYIANDYGPDRFLHNESTPGKLNFRIMEGSRTFTTPASCVMGHDSFKSMGVDFTDFNRDGIADIAVSNIASKNGLMESNFVWMSNGTTDSMRQGKAPYTQVSEQLGLSRSGWAWDCRMADFDNDGQPEALYATGFIKGKVNRWPEVQSVGSINSSLLHDPRSWPRFTTDADVSGDDKNTFFARGADGKYVDIATNIGVAFPATSRGIAVGDPDGDGDSDFIVANQWQPSYYCKNSASSNGRFLGLHILRSVEANAPFLNIAGGHPRPGMALSPAIGAVATLHYKGKVVAQVDGGTGHSGKRSHEVIFGLGEVVQETNFQVDLAWRSADGMPCRKKISLTPGWHTVILGRGSK